MSRCVRDWLDGEGRAVVRGVQRRTCQLVVETGPLLVLSTPDVPLPPNGLAVDMAPCLTLVDAGLEVGQVIALGAGDVAAGHVDWIVTFAEASTWEPRPCVHRIAPPDLVDRLRTVRSTVVAEGAGESLLPLLWTSPADGVGLQRGVVPRAGSWARLLLDAAIRGDAAALGRAARGLAGLGRGLTPSGDDLLAGFVAAWILVGEALGHDRLAREPVTAAVVAGAARGASPVGRCWLEHARRGELPEPMTRLVDDLLAPESRDLGAAARGVLRVGASSGTDWMVGFILAAETMLDPTTSRRPW